MAAHENDNYYDVLKVAQTATTAEIVSAYHRAKNAFSKDSLATYSLFDEAETEPILQKLEEAYQVLTNVHKRAEYDQILQLRAQGENIPLTFTELDLQKKAKESREASRSPEPAPAAEPMIRRTVHEPPVVLEAVTGTEFKRLRSKKGLSVRDVARITKISSRHIEAIEEDKFKNLPVRVYLQGYIKSLAAVYRLKPDETLKLYLEYLKEKEVTTDPV